MDDMILLKLWPYCNQSTALNLAIGFKMWTSHLITMQQRNKMTGAILASGRSGRKTTLWTEQKGSFDKETVILCLSTNLTQWFERSLVQNTAYKVLWTGFWTLFENKLREMVRKTCRLVTLWNSAQPLADFWHGPWMSYPLVMQS